MSPSTTAARRMHADVAKCHACHAKWRSISPSATPATQNAHRCRQVPRLPRKVEVDVAKCHACHANSRGDNGVHWEPSAPPEPAQSRKCHACHAECTSMPPSARPATQNARRCRQVPRVPGRMHVDVAKGHACHANSRGDNGVHWEPSVPPEPAQCRKCHACHAECTSMPPSARLATQRAAATTASTGNQARHQSQPSPVSATPATQNARRCRQVPDLPRRMHVYVAKCHACQAECTLTSPRSTGNQARHQSQPSAVSATPATHWLSGFHVDCQGITWRDRLKQKWMVSLSWWLYSSWSLYLKDSPLALDVGVTRHGHQP